MVLQNVHELNYRFTHGIDARSRQTECASCHSTQTFCAQCHEAGGNITQVAFYLDSNGDRTPSTDRALTPRGVSGEGNPSERRTLLPPAGIDGAGSDASAADLRDGARAAGESQASVAVMDTFFALFADGPLSEE